MSGKCFALNSFQPAAAVICLPLFVQQIVSLWPFFLPYFQAVLTDHKNYTEWQHVCSSVWLIYICCTSCFTESLQVGIRHIQMEDDNHLPLGNLAALLNKKLRL